jgi:hypothetical protein
MTNQEFSILWKRFTQNDPTLTSLNLWRRAPADQGKSVAETLKFNTALTSLSLACNNHNVGAEGAKALAEVLKVNTTLRRLNLWRTEVFDEGTLVLAEALKVNTTLRRLNLGFNEIGDEGAKALAEALKVNTTLTNLNLGSNTPLSVAVYNNIYAMLEINKRLALWLTQEKKKQTEVDVLLFSAATTGQLEAIKILVEEYGANLSMENEQGKTTVQIAQDAGHNIVSAWLKNKRKSNAEVRKNARVLAQTRRMGFFEGAYFVGSEVLIEIAALTGNGDHEYDNKIARDHF